MIDRSEERLAAAGCAWLLFSAGVSYFLHLRTPELPVLFLVQTAVFALIGAALAAVAAVDAALTRMAAEEARDLAALGARDRDLFAAEDLEDGRRQRSASRCAAWTN